MSIYCCAGSVRRLVLLGFINAYRTGGGQTAICKLDCPPCVPIEYHRMGLSQNPFGFLGVGGTGRGQTPKCQAPHSWI